jgi:hypothetical protein
MITSRHGEALARLGRCHGQAKEAKQDKTNVTLETVTYLFLCVTDEEGRQGDHLGTQSRVGVLVFTAYLGSQVCTALPWVNLKNIVRTLMDILALICTLHNT